MKDNYKTLKFKPHLIEPILNGKKYSTWRLYDDKDLQKADKLIFLNKDTLDKFARAEVESVLETTLGKVEEDKGFDGHERFASVEEMYETYRKYYGPKLMKILP